MSVRIHELLSFAAQNKPQKLIENRIQRLVGRPVDVEIDQTAQGIGCVGNPLVARGDVAAGLTGDGQRQHLDSSGNVSEPSVADTQRIVGDFL